MIFLYIHGTFNHYRDERKEIWNGLFWNNVLVYSPLSQAHSRRTTTTFEIALFCLVIIKELTELKIG